jgi:hypothetical protein
MPLYPVTIRRCQHIKVNGMQCGSPARRDEPCCHFHLRWRTIATNVHLKPGEQETIILPTLEDANSIQVGLAEMLRLLASNRIDHKAAALMLYALQTAASNVRHTSFEPEPTRVVIDRESVEQRPIGASAWSAVEGREYDELVDDNAAAENASKEKEEKREDDEPQDEDSARWSAWEQAWAESQRLKAEKARLDPEWAEAERLREIRNRLLPGESCNARNARVAKQESLENQSP